MKHTRLANSHTDQVGNSFLPCLMLLCPQAQLGQHHRNFLSTPDFCKIQEFLITVCSCYCMQVFSVHLPRFARGCQSGRGMCCLNRPRKTFAHLTPKLSRSASIQSCVAKITFCLFLVARFHAWHRFKYLISDSIHIQILFHIYIFNRNLFHLTA